jgi:hypothetical protein
MHHRNSSYVQIQTLNKYILYNYKIVINSYILNLCILNTYLLNCSWININTLHQLPTLTTQLTCQADNKVKLESKSFKNNFLLYYFITMYSYFF